MTDNFHEGIGDLVQEVGKDRITYLVIAEQAADVSATVMFQAELVLYPSAALILQHVRTVGAIAISGLAEQMGVQSDDARRAFEEIIAALERSGTLDSIPSDDGGPLLIAGPNFEHFQESRVIPDVRGGYFVPSVSRMVSSGAVVRQKDIEKLEKAHSVVFLERLAECPTEDDVAERVRIWAYGLRAPKYNVLQGGVGSEVLQRAGLIARRNRVVGVNVEKVNQEVDAFHVVRCYLYDTASIGKQEKAVTVRRHRSKHRDLPYAVRIGSLMRDNERITQTLSAIARSLPKQL